ncbi:hypothetical protein PHYBLDRAFT_164266 [Phycomyces blakesleeanus NRRL 1555(-)]|uniref:Major facilitator superfamily associated domain-containing protein n=1 Tax=Phycomyces blakesleeanus (strain ATCC 8743b / DSM 1359 / FGSC 10004 / NBRC 33097 / NRRL 1555) TaxID=763407 RepID=A0A167P6K8_PHYB8|nr:hypothetical protein PHYBLDRAFT_164266 [Phycomyces blakesleeanus NRRL 1555(-)]OAD77348.1 hypothetical protein PHYBLDRAFT_164266 [Phycomyces blakesleeanus NRRL 1555(-)]|eukprot:XP_018295388.1 hypothetical protein PHYBLDRAFT_164266 [Phycomyces blakesleeanus NRRL 1555(-)]
MLTWLHLFTFAHAFLESSAFFVPLALVQQFDVSPKISYLVAAAFALRMTSAIWIWIIDSRPTMHGPLMACLSLTSTAALITIFFIPQSNILVWISLLFIIYHATYQPLSVILDSLIIKVLGDYRMLLFAAQRQWGLMIAPLMLLIGLVHWIYPQPLLFILVGYVTLGSLGFACIGFACTNPEAVDPSELANVNELAPFFLKNALQPTDTRTSAGPNSSIYNPLYQPYSLFGEQLSHISEEDASLLQRMASPQSLMRNPSISSHYSYGSTLSQPNLQQQQQQQQNGLFPENAYLNTNPSNNGQSIEMSFTVLPVSSLDLALIPNPCPEDPMGVLVMLRHPEDYFPYNYLTNLPLQWRIQSVLLSMLLLGIASGMLGSLLPIYLYRGLGMPLWLVCVGASVQVMCVFVVYTTIGWWIRNCSPMLLSSCVHGFFISSALCYTMLIPHSPVSWGASVFLQGIQALCLHLAWCVATSRLNAFAWIDQQRMMERGKASALYSSIGPAVGALIAGCIVGDDTTWRIGFVNLFHTTVPFVALSFVVSWGWTMEE